MEWIDPDDSILIVLLEQLILCNCLDSHAEFACGLFA